MTTPEAETAPQDASEEAVPTENAPVEGSIADAWRQISSEQLDAYYAARDAPDSAAAAAVLEGALCLPTALSDVRQAARVTFTMQVLDFARQRRLMGVKAGVLFNLSQMLLHAVASELPRAEAQQLVKDLVVPLVKAHAAPAAPELLAADVAAVAAFLEDRFFSNYQLYQYVFTNDREVDDTVVEEFVELPRIQGFNGVAVPEDEWQKRQEEAAAEKAAQEEKRAAEAEAKQKAEKEVARAKKKADEEYRRKQELSRKPATLEEAIQKEVGWRVEAERKKLEAGYMAEIAALQERLAALKA